MTIKSGNLRNSLDVNELITALPKDVNEEGVLKDPLGDLISQISTRKVPVGSLIRLWTLGSMQAKIVIGYLAYAIRSKFMNDSNKQRLLNETNLAAAIKLFGTMGYMRGAIMKVGQILGNLPTILPQEFADVLGALHFEAPPMHYSMIREVFLDELGKEPEDVFASFDKKAFAAASLGQVHRARLKTGEEVAVKIQYPNMMRTIQSDMRNLRALFSAMRFRSDFSYLLAHLKDAEEMLTLEADYKREAGFLAQAYEIFKNHDQIVVPEFFEEFSTGRVLTMSYLPGKHLPDFVKENPSQELRDHFGELISVAVIRLSYHSKAFYADPHPGNFLMMEDGRLGFIDFGCCREFTEEEWAKSNQGERALLANDFKSFDEVIAYGCLHEKIEDMEKDRVELVRKSGEWQVGPALKDECFNFGDDEWYQSGVDIMVDIAKLRNNRYGPVWNWTNRTIFGHRTLMYRLKCNINLCRLYHDNNPWSSSADN